MSKLTEEEQKRLEEKMDAAPVVTGDLAFDPTVARQCDRDGCTNDGELRPVLLLRPGRDYTGKPMRFPLGIVVCKEHVERMPDKFITEDMWKDSVSGFKGRGMQPPHRTSTRVEYDPHGPPKLDS